MPRNDGDAEAVVLRARQLEAALERSTGCFELALLRREDPADVPEAGLERQGGGRLHGKRALRPVARFGEVAAHAPERGQSDHEPGRGLGVSGCDHVPQRRAEVVVVALENHEPGLLVDACAVRRLRHERREVLGVARPQRFRLAADGELLERILPDDLEHQHARLALARRPEQAVRDERLELAQQDVLVDAADRGHGLDRRAAREDGETGEQSLLVLVEEAEAPVDGRAHRLLTRRRVPAAGDEQLDPRRQPLEQGGRAQQRRPCCGKLDREREILELGAELRNDGRVLRPEGHADRARPALEQRCGVGARQRRNDETLLGVDAQKCAAGDDDAQLLHPGEELADERRRFDDLLEVVEDEQELEPPRSCSASGRSTSRPSDVAIAAGTRSGSTTVSSDTNAAPFASEPPSLWASSSASRVLPMPPGPVSVRSLQPERKASAPSSSSRSRPTSGVAGCGSRTASAARRRRGPVLAQDRLFELVEAPRRLDPELVDERRAGVAVDGERVALAAAPVEREHQQRTQALAQRILATSRSSCGIAAACVPSASSSSMRASSA